MRGRDPRSPLRVLITTDAVSETWTHVRTLVRALHPSVAFTVAVLGPAAPGGRADTWPAQVHHFPCRLEWMDAPWADVRASGAWLEGLARAVAPDLVHVNGYSHASLDFDVPVLVGAHACACCRWRDVHGVPAPAEWNTYRRMVQYGLRSATHVVAPTAAMLSALQAEHGRLPPSSVIAAASDALDASEPSVRTMAQAYARLYHDLVAPVRTWPLVPAAWHTPQAAAR